MSISRQLKCWIREEHYLISFIPFLMLMLANVDSGGAWKGSLSGYRLPHDILTSSWRLQETSKVRNYVNWQRQQQDEMSNRYYSNAYRQFRKMQFKVAQGTGTTSTPQQLPPIAYSTNPLPATSMGDVKGMVAKEFYLLPHIKPHEDVGKLAIKYMKTFDKFEQHQLIGLGTLRSFEKAKSFVEEFYCNRTSLNGHNSPKYVVLDSGCGRGMSSLMLAQMYPEYPIIGIDRSFNRLAKSRYFTSFGERSSKNEFDVDDDDGYDDLDDDDEHCDEDIADKNLGPLSRRKIREILPKPDNLLFIQAELVAFWLLAARKSDWTVKSHYILHPNPYAKKSLLRKRWHAQPSFATIMALGGELIMRSNWQTYIEETKLAIQMARSMFTKDTSKVKDIPVEIFPPPDIPSSKVTPMTHFEKKYLVVGVPMYEMKTNLGIRDPTDRNLFLDGLRLFNAEQSPLHLKDQDATELVRVYRNFLLS